MQLSINYNNASPLQRRLARQEYVEAQNGLCYHCQGPLDKDVSESNMKAIDKSMFPDGFFNWPVHLHHSHKTGLTLGAVHACCNAILWQYYGE